MQLGHLRGQCSVYLFADTSDSIRGTSHLGCMISVLEILATC